MPSTSAGTPAPTTSIQPPIWARPAPPPRQRALGRPEIVAAAIALADDVGAAGLTMKAVAARLGAYTPMALYRYVHSKDGLVDLMLDAATAEVPLPAPGGQWRADLAHVATSTRNMIKNHLWYAELVHTRAPAGPHMMHRIEFVLTTLVNQGVAVPAAMTYAAMIDRHIYGAGLQEAQEVEVSRAQGLDNPSAFLAAIATVHDLAETLGDVPLLASWLAQPSGPSVDEQFELGLAFLLDGIAGQIERVAEGS
jgi:AcrR family transcriptional regulator